LLRTTPRAATALNPALRASSATESSETQSEGRRETCNGHGNAKATDQEVSTHTCSIWRISLIFLYGRFFVDALKDLGLKDTTVCTPSVAQRTRRPLCPQTQWPPRPPMTYLPTRRLSSQGGAMAHWRPKWPRHFMREL
jgi:hypothetical protein